MNEAQFKVNLANELRSMFPGSIVLINDGLQIQGFPDILILYGQRWAALECKIRENARHQPNQDYYVDLLDSMSFASFIYPENKEDVLRDLQRAL